jgi:hypothetical protein
MENFLLEMRAVMLSAVRVANLDLVTDDAELVNLAVSFDGTWMTRGHRSHIGVGFVIDCVTGFVVDFEVLSNFCEICYKKELIFLLVTS